MALAELIAFAVGALRGHRLRTVLSVAGVAVGISAVVALTAIPQRPSLVKRSGPRPGSASMVARISRVSGSITEMVPASASVT